MRKYTHLSLYTDGASRGNPGLAAVGVCILDQDHQTIAAFGNAIGIATNNAAEYLAVISALEWLCAHKDQLAETLHMAFHTDSQLVGHQLNGVWRIREPELQQMVASIRNLLRQLPGSCSFTSIPREKNRMADRLANEALDNTAIDSDEDLSPEEQEFAQMVSESINLFMLPEPPSHLTPRMARLALQRLITLDQQFGQEVMRVMMGIYQLDPSRGPTNGRLDSEIFRATSRRDTGSHRTIGTEKI
jgi:ribonuclease HI